MDLLNLLSPSYLFATTPGQAFKYFWICFVFFMLLLAIGQFLRSTIKNSHHKKTLKRLLPGVTSRLAWTSLAGLVFLFFRYENIPYLAMRIFLIIIILIGLYQIGKIGYIYTKVLPCEIDKQHAKKDNQRYIPQPKKKKKGKR